jgi:hypothetical protein
MTTFADLQTGDTFTFAALVSREGWEKTGPHQARLVNKDETRNVADGEQVHVLYAAADRAARLRETHYQDAAGWHRKHDVHGGPHDEPPGVTTETGEQQWKA